MSMSWKFQY